MVDDELHAVVLVVAVDLLIGLQEEVLEDGGTQEGVLLAAPVVVVEDGVGVEVGADALGQLQLPVGEVLDEVVHLIGVLHVVHQGFLNGAEVVALLEDARGDEGGLVGLGAVHGVIHGLGGVPQLLGELQGRGLDVLLPLLDVLDHDLLRRMYREGAGGVGGERLGDAPAVDHVLHALLQQRLGHEIGVEQQGNRLVLVDEPVGVAAANHFAHVFLGGQHRMILP